MGQQQHSARCKFEGAGQIQLEGQTLQHRASADSTGTRPCTAGKRPCTWKDTPCRERYYCQSNTDPDACSVHTCRQATYARMSCIQVCITHCGSVRIQENRDALKKSPHCNAISLKRQVPGWGIVLLPLPQRLQVLRQSSGNVGCSVQYVAVRLVLASICLQRG